MHNCRRHRLSVRRCDGCCGCTCVHNSVRPSASVTMSSCNLHVLSFQQLKSVSGPRGAAHRDRNKLKIQLGLVTDANHLSSLPLLIFGRGLSLLRPFVLGLFVIHSLLFCSFVTRYEDIFRKPCLGHRCVCVGKRSGSCCGSWSEFLLVDIGSTCLSLTNVQSPPLQPCPPQERCR